jgi:hypothetical protein
MPDNLRLLRVDRKANKEYMFDNQGSDTQKSIYIRNLFALKSRPHPLFKK